MTRDVALNYIGLKSIGYIMLHYIYCSCPYIWLADSGSNIQSKITWSKMTFFDDYSSSQCCAPLSMTAGLEHDTKQAS